MRAYVREMEDVSIKSKIMFQGDFDKELKKIINEAEKVIIKNILPCYGIHYTEYGDYIIKIKINDKKLLIEKLITCFFSYKKNDVKFGYINLEFIVTEKGKKTKKYSLGKFTISDTDKIIDIFLNKLVEIIEEF